MKWYVINTYFRRENRAFQEVRNLEFITDTGEQLSMPLETYFAKRSARITIKKQRPLFTRYIFVRFSLNLPSWGLIPLCNSVRGVLDHDGTPQPVPDGFVARVKSAEEMGLFDQTTAHLRMSPGDRVEITEGPFANQIAVFINAPSKKRVEVLLEIMGAPQKFSFSTDQIRKVT